MFKAITTVVVATAMSLSLASCATAPVVEEAPGKGASTVSVPKVTPSVKPSVTADPDASPTATATPTATPKATTKATPKATPKATKATTKAKPKATAKAKPKAKPKATAKAKPKSKPKATAQAPKPKPKPKQTTQAPKPKVTTKDVKIPHGTKRVNDNSIPKGQTKVRTKGVDGVKRVTYTNGKVTSEKVIKNPVTEVIAVGTYVSKTKPTARIWYCDANDDGTVAGVKVKDPDNVGYTVTIVAAGRSKSFSATGSSNFSYGNDTPNGTCSYSIS